MELPLSSCERTSLLQGEPFAPVETEQRPMVITQPHGSLAGGLWRPN
jgi:hypothetical protein